MTLLLPIIVLYYSLEVLWGLVNHKRDNTGEDRKCHASKCIISGVFQKKNNCHLFKMAIFSNYLVMS